VLRRQFWIGLILALVFLYLFFYRVDMRQVVATLGQVNYLLVIPAVLAYQVGLWLRAVRWRFILLPLARVGPQRLFTPLVISFALNNILPGRVGLVARAYMAGEREGINKVSMGATVVLDQVFEGLALVFLLVALSLFFPLTGWARHIATLAISLYGAFLFLFFLSISSPHILRRLVRPFLRSRWKEKGERWLEMALSGVRAIRSPGSLALILLFSLLVWFMEAGVFYFMAVAFKLDLPFSVLLLASTIANVAMNLPSLPGGVGPYEYFGRQTIILFGVDGAVATAYVGVVHMVLLLPGTLLGLVLLSLQRGSLRRFPGSST
jgi:uncharacterized protein (TIRG00374 family)